MWVKHLKHIWWIELAIIYEHTSVGCHIDHEEQLMIQIEGHYQQFSEPEKQNNMYIH